MLMIDLSIEMFSRYRVIRALQSPAGGRLPRKSKERVKRA